MSPLNSPTFFFVCTSIVYAHEQDISIKGKHAHRRDMPTGETCPQTTDIIPGQANCLALHVPTHDLSLQATKSRIIKLTDSSKLQNFNLKFLVSLRKPKWHNKAHRWELVLAKAFHNIQ
jgi:hypothetical protein